MIFKRKKSTEEKKEKQPYFERTGKPAFIVLCIWSVLFLLAYSILFFLKLYKNDDGNVDMIRILLSSMIFLVPTVCLFVRRKFPYKIPNLVNFFVSGIYSGIIIIESFVMLQYEQGFTLSMLTGVRFLLLNLIIYIAVYLVVFAITDSFRLSVAGVTIFNLVLGIINYYLCQFRGVGFLAVDITNAGTAANVASGYSYAIDYPTYLLLITSMAVISIAYCLDHNVYFRGWKRLIPLLVGCLAIAYPYKTFIVSSHYDKVLKIKYYKPQETFATNGLPITFVKSINDLIVKEPEGYSIEAVEEIAKEYPGITSASTDEEKPNVIVIMDEAFTDFTQIYDVTLNEDNMPFIHSHTENTITGQFFTSIFGGGTASTEFEVLTGDSMAFVPNGITAYSAYINSDMQNLTTVLEEQGYGGDIAMHPFRGNGYSRSKVYPLLGFKEFLTQDDFAEDTDRYGKYISDTADMERIVEEYENYEKTKTDDQPFYMFNVTMQNHSPFTSDSVDDSIKVTSEDYDAPELNNYVNMIRATDDAVKELVTYFENTDDPTMIVFFGDHEPKVEDEFYNEQESTYKLDDSYQSYWKHTTQYYIWTNYDIESAENQNLSANYLSSKILDTAGLSMSGYQQFLQDIQKDIVAITKKGYVGANGQFYSNSDETSPYYNTWLKYNIVEYNHLFDTDNTVESFFSIPESK